jgi:hypothetical protein
LAVLVHAGDAANNLALSVQATFQAMVAQAFAGSDLAQRTLFSLRSAGVWFFLCDVHRATSRAVIYLLDTCEPTFK